MPRSANDDAYDELSPSRRGSPRRFHSACLDRELKKRQFRARLKREGRVLYHTGRLLDINAGAAVVTSSVIKFYCRLRKPNLLRYCDTFPIQTLPTNVCN